MTTTIVPTSTATEPTDEKAHALANEQAVSLRRLADIVEANPNLARTLAYALKGIIVPLVWDGQRDDMAAWARAAAQAGAKVDKQVRDNYDQFKLIVTIGALGLEILADRDEVCERVVTGTREVTEEVPDPEALAAVPKVTVTKVVEDVEWRCGSLLAPAAGGGA